MTTAIAIRDLLAVLVGEEFPEIATRSQFKRKLDVIERYPASAVYLGEMSSEPASFRGGRERDQEIVVELYRTGTGDLESAFAVQADAFESAVETARQAGRFPAAMKGIYLSAAVMSFTPDGRGREGSLALTFTANTYANL